MYNGSPNSISSQFSRWPGDIGMVIKEMPFVSGYSSFIQSRYASVKFVPVELCGPTYDGCNQLIAVNTGQGCVVLDIYMYEAF